MVLKWHCTWVQSLLLHVSLRTVDDSSQRVTEATRSLEGSRHTAGKTKTPFTFRCKCSRVWSALDREVTSTILHFSNQGENVINSSTLGTFCHYPQRSYTNQKCKHVWLKCHREKSLLSGMLSASSTIWNSSGAKRRPTETRVGRMSVSSLGCKSLTWQRPIGEKVTLRHSSFFQWFCVEIWDREWDLLQELSGGVLASGGRLVEGGSELQEMHGWRQMLLLCSIIQQQGFL